MIQIKVITHESYEDFLKLLQFRYKVYINELSFINAKHEFVMLQMEFDQFDRFSTFIILEKDEEIIGCARIIEDKGNGLPVYMKANFHIFENEKNIEVGRLIINKSQKNGRYLPILLNEILKLLGKMSFTYALADTFINSESYKILRKLGFKESGIEYNDSFFQCEEISTALFYKKEDMIKEINEKINKSQNAVLKYCERSSVGKIINNYQDDKTGKEV